MCGIAGAVSLGDGVVDASRVDAMTCAIAHRGPDATRVWHDDRVALGHRRLAIIDLSPAGTQPMANEDGTLRITFNGEIYNFQKYVPELRGLGHRFSSRTDTEVILHLYEQYGIEGALDRLNGMFAFGLWDAGRQQLILARDRVGEKPLYYARVGDTLWFASEVKAMLAAGVVTPRLNRSALDDYLTFLAVPAPETLFEGVNKLPPGHYLVADTRGTVSLRRYWAPRPRAPEARNFEECIDEVDALLTDSASLRMIADVPVGLFLSGGIDSSLNLALATESTGAPIHTFSVGYAGLKRAGELDAARETARRFGSRHHEVIISREEFEQFLPSLSHHQDEPIADPVCVPIHFLARAARAEHVPVVHVGEGADELFAGYPRFGQLFRARRRFWEPARRWPGFLRRATAAAGRAAVSKTRYRKYRGVLDEFARGGEIFWGGHIEFYSDERRAVLGGESVLDPVASRVAAWHESAQAAGCSDYLAQMTYLELQMRLPELLLMRVDKLTMANSIEARVPFLDPRLVELALGIPADWKLRGGSPKALLRRIAARRVPHLDLTKPKVGFGVPFHDWFGQGLATTLRQAIFDSSFVAERVLDTNEVERMFRLTAEGRVNYHGHLWCLANLALWYDHWIAGGALTSAVQ